MIYVLQLINSGKIATIIPSNLFKYTIRRINIKNKIALPKVYSDVYRYYSNNKVTHASSNTQKNSNN